MFTKISDHPIYSQKELLDQFADMTDENNKEIVANFLSDFMGISVDEIYNYTKS